MWLVTAVLESTAIERLNQSQGLQVQLWVAVRPHTRNSECLHTECWDSPVDVSCLALRILAASLIYLRQSWWISLLVN